MSKIVGRGDPSGKHNFLDSLTNRQDDGYRNSDPFCSK